MADKVKWNETCYLEVVIDIGGEEFVRQIEVEVHIDCGKQVKALGEDYREEAEEINESVRQQQVSAGKAEFVRLHKKMPLIQMELKDIRVIDDTQYSYCIEQ